MPLNPTLVGTETHDLLESGITQDIVVGLAGDDVISTAAGADVIVGDYDGTNLLASTEGATSFSQYDQSGDWTVGQDSAGRSQMSQSVATVAGANYEISFELAANYGAGVVSGAVDVLWNGEVVGSFDTSSGAFSDAALAFQGTGDVGELTFRARESDDVSGPAINTDGPVFWYEKDVELGGETRTVKAFAEGQPNIYQVMNGQLNVFDPETETYAPAGASATVVINAIGFNQEDDLIYGLAVGNGTDALGNTVARADLMMIDAEGNSYRVGETPYRSWTGDFDENGNLWAFHSSMDRLTMIDVDQLDADGNPLTTTFKFPANMITDSVWDVAFDAASQSFYGLVRPSSEGQAAKLMQIDVSAVASGGEPSFNITPVTQTDIDGNIVDGIPSITFGAFMIDGDGNFYAGGNGGDHDMDNSTGTSGGIYRVERSADGSTATLVLVSDAPKSYSNDGAVDPRAIDPFAATDPAAMVLIRGPELVEVENPAESYDDTIMAGAGQDVAIGGFGEDLIIGQSHGDTLEGNSGDDRLYGGAGPDSTSTAKSYYDEEGLRYDADGNLLPEDDDALYGGAGNDLLDGSAGHDQLFGGSGDDILTGGSGNDVLFGGTGTDTLSGGSHDDTLSGEEGDDDLSGGSGDDVMDGGAGNDVLVGGSGDDVMAGGIGNDSGKGGSGNDHLIGGEGDDRLDGGTGNDTIEGGAGADYIKAGSNDDTVSAGDGKDYINAGSGDDVLDGGAGNDKMYLGAGNDLAFGGAGSDKFVFRTEDLDGSTDRIADFTRNGSEADRLDFRGLNLLENTDELTWIAQNVSEASNGDVVFDLSGTNLILTSQSGDYFQSVLDGLMF